MKKPPAKTAPAPQSRPAKPHPSGKAPPTGKLPPQTAPSKTGKTKPPAGSGGVTPPAASGVSPSTAAVEPAAPEPAKLDVAKFRKQLRELWDALRSGAVAGLPDLDAAAEDRIVRHARLLDQKTRLHNLVGLKDRERWAAELYVDSALLLPAIADDPVPDRPSTGADTGTVSGPVADLGSGAGFPGLVLASVLPDVEVVLVDSNGKKVGFLAEAALRMSLPRADARQERLEDFARAGKRGRCSAAVFKALGPWSVGLEYAVPLLRAGGKAVFFQGKDPPDPAALARVCAELGAEPAGVQAYRLPGGPTDRHIITVRKIAPTPAEYPRAVGVPEKRPLEVVLRPRGEKPAVGTVADADAGAAAGGGPPATTDAE